MLLLFKINCSEFTYLVTDSAPYALLLHDKIRMGGCSDNSFGRTTFGADGTTGAHIHIDEPAS
jgi:hypothetical protein